MVRSFKIGPGDSEVFNMEIKKYPNAFVRVYMPGCPYCEVMQPAWNELAANMHKNYSGDLGVFDVHREALQNINPEHIDVKGVSSFPTILAFTSNKKPHQYDGEREERAMRHFLETNYNISAEASKHLGAILKRRKSKRKSKRKKQIKLSGGKKNKKSKKKKVGGAEEGPAEGVPPAPDKALGWAPPPTSLDVYESKNPDAVWIRDQILSIIPGEQRHDSDIVMPLKFVGVKRLIEYLKNIVLTEGKQLDEWQRQFHEQEEETLKWQQLFHEQKEAMVKVNEELKQHGFISYSPERGARRDAPTVHKKRSETAGREALNAFYQRN